MYIRALATIGLRQRGEKIKRGMMGDIKIISSRKIYEVLDFVKRRPEILLTSKSITGLQNFINGYMMLGAADDIYHPGEPTMDEFKYWILHKDEGLSGMQNPTRVFYARNATATNKKRSTNFLNT